MSEHLHIEGLQVQAQGRPLLHGLRLQPLAAGQLVGVLGANGAGKSTLVKALAGRVAAQGQLRWGQQPLHGLSQARRSQWLGYLPQALLQPCRLTVEAVLMATLAATCPGLPAGGRQCRLQEAVATLQLQDLLGQRLDTLSGGQRQRVGLAQVLVRDTPVLLLDEPTSALDLRWQVETLQCLRDWASRPGRLVLAVLHDPVTFSSETGGDRTGMGRRHPSTPIRRRYTSPVIPVLFPRTAAFRPGPNRRIKQLPQDELRRCVGKVSRFWHAMVTIRRLRRTVGPGCERVRLGEHSQARCHTQRRRCGHSRLSARPPMTSAAASSFQPGSERGLLAKVARQVHHHDPRVAHRQCGKHIQRRVAAAIVDHHDLEAVRQGTQRFPEFGQHQGQAVGLVVGRDDAGQRRAVRPQVRRRGRHFVISGPG